jgi:hypothetical protein
VTPPELVDPGNGSLTILRPFNKCLPIVAANVPEGYNLNEQGWENIRTTILYSLI